MAKETILTVYQSATPSAEPVLAVGEFGYNSADNKLWIGGTGGALKPITMYLVEDGSASNQTLYWNTTDSRWAPTLTLAVDEANGTVSIGSGMSPDTSVSLVTDSSWVGTSDGLSGLHTQNIAGNSFLITGAVGSPTGNQILSLNASLINFSAGGLGAMQIASSGISFINNLVQTVFRMDADGYLIANFLPVGPTDVPTGGLYRSGAGTGALIQIK